MSSIFPTPSLPPDLYHLSTYEDGQFGSFNALPDLVLNSAFEDEFSELLTSDSSSSVSPLVVDDPLRFAAPDFSSFSDATKFPLAISPDFSPEPSSDYPIRPQKMKRSATYHYLPRRELEPPPRLRSRKSTVGLNFVIQNGRAAVKPAADMGSGSPPSTANSDAVTALASTLARTRLKRKESQQRLKRSSSTRSLRSARTSPSRSPYKQQSPLASPYGSVAAQTPARGTLAPTYDAIPTLNQFAFESPPLDATPREQTFVFKEYQPKANRFQKLN